MKLKKGDLILLRITYGKEVALDWDTGYLIVLEIKAHQIEAYNIGRKKKEEYWFTEYDHKTDWNAMSQVYKVERKHTEREVYIEVDGLGQLTNNRIMIKDGRYQQV